MCRFTITMTALTGLHSGRPCYRVECDTHGLLHPSTTGPAHAINNHLDHNSHVWFDQNEKSAGVP